MSVLLVSDWRKDGHLRPVADELSRRGVATYVFNPAQFPSSASITTEATDAGPRACLTWNDETLDLSTVRSVWHRRPGAYAAPGGLLPEEAEWLRLECKQFIDGLWATTGALWVSEPERIRTANLKLLQMKLARELGFRVPAYCVTNDPVRARAFIVSQPEGVIAKALVMPWIESESLGAGSIYTHRVTEEDLGYLDSVRHGPTFFQAYVRKLRDIRVTVIGNRVFAVGIETAGVESAAIDFRVPEPWDIPHVPLTLPEALEQACLDLVRRFGLNFGAIDLLETASGEYFFLEINPNGQWYWLEMMTGLPMAAAMADLLERGRQGSVSVPPPAPVKKPVTIPVGTHTISLTPSLQGRLAALDGGCDVDLVGTRVWLERKQGSVLLHMGDSDLGGS